MYLLVSSSSSCLSACNPAGGQRASEPANKPTPPCLSPHPGAGHHPCAPTVSTPVPTTMLPSWDHDLQLLLRRSMAATTHRTLSLPLGRPSDDASPPLPLRAALAPRQPPCRMNYAALHAPPVSRRRLFACRVSLFPLPLMAPPPLAAPRRLPPGPAMDSNPYLLISIHYTTRPRSPRLTQVHCLSPAMHAPISMAVPCRQPALPRTRGRKLPLN